MDVEKLGDQIGKALKGRRKTRQRGRLWLMRDGTAVRVKDMDDQHVKNAHAMAVRRDDAYWMMRLSNEMREREALKQKGA